MAKRKSAAPEEQPPPAAVSSGAPEEQPPPSATGGYTVLARRYRPQQFGDLVGQEPVARALVNAIESQRVAHAYLFTGARGVGKTSTARILAKALNCVKGPTPTPCDACDLCRSIALGEDVDVLEIDGASNRGIDEVRELRRNVGYCPSRGRYKIYIIDEVHMLTKEAFNALLKTLEEPPPHVKFIFATTEVQKIPLTILSRCQRFDFAGIGTARIVERLRQVVADEKLQADAEALEWIARRAGGSMRDAQSLLDQLLAFSSESGEKRLAIDQVHRLLGTAHDDRVVALASAVLEHDAKQTLALLGQAADEGLLLGELLDQLIDYWRDLMVVHCAGIEGRELSVSAKHREVVGKQAAAVPMDTILAGLDILATAKVRLRGTSHGRILLEMALVRMSRLDDLVSLSQLAQWLRQAGPGPAGPAPATRRVAPELKGQTPVANTPGAPAPKGQTPVENAPGSPVGQPPVAHPPGQPPVAHAPGSPSAPPKGIVPLEVGGAEAHQSPVTSHQSPVTPHQSPVTSHQSPVTSHQSPLTSHQSPVTSHPSPVTSHQSPVTSVSLTEETLPEVWRNVLRQIGPFLAGNLEKASGVAISGPNTLVVRFAPVYNLDQEHCQEPSRLARIEEVLRKVTGRGWKLRVETVPGEAAAPLAPAADTEKTQSRYRRQRAEAVQEPLVKRAIEQLGAQIVHVDEGFGAAPAEPAERAPETDIQE